MKDIMNLRKVREEFTAARTRIGPLRAPKRRLVDPETRSILPETGDLARVLEDVPLEGGVLRRGQNVLVEIVTEPMEQMVGVKWRDDEGTHVMALDRSKLEIVP